MDSASLHRLHPHPLTPAPMIRSLEAGIAWGSDGSLKLSFRLFGDMARLRIPQTLAPDRLDNLWEHTCFEVFLAEPCGSRYREFNVAPSGQWAAYAFHDYRKRDETPLASSQPRTHLLLSDGRLELDVSLAADALPCAAACPGLQIGLSAVIEHAYNTAHSNSYWALYHPAARPDFHHRDGFTLKLAAPNRPA